MSALTTIAEPGRAAIHDCWNRIGVHGDASCAALKRHVHCRNCPIYEAAASQFLDVPPADDHASQWTPLIAQKQRVAADMERLSLVIFRLGEELLALPTSVFKEVVGASTIHSMPHRRDGIVLGMANVRGELVVCASLPHILGLESSPGKAAAKQRSTEPRMLVIAHEGTQTAFPVDEVHEVGHFNTAELGKVPSTLARATAVYIRALLPWRNQSVGILDEQLVTYIVNRSLTLATAT